MSDIVITHLHGMLAIYTRNGDTELTQRALIDISDEERTARELVDIVDELSLRFGWRPRQLPVGRAAVAADGVVALERKREYNREYYQRTRSKAAKQKRAGHEEMAHRRAAIVGYVRDHPDATVSEITRALMPDVPHEVAVSSVRKSCEILAREGQLTRTRDQRIWLHRVLA